MNDPLNVSEPDWESFQDLDYARKLLDICKERGIVRDTQAEEIRFWAARSFAMRKGRNPTSYFRWLLSHADVIVPSMDEDAARADYKGIDFDRDGSSGMVGDTLKEHQ